MASHVLFPGTFDPPTLGHLDLVQRATRLFARVTVGLAEHPTKSALFSVEERLEFLGACVKPLRGVDVVRLEGLVVQACEELGCDAILRGLRSGGDYDYEAQMARTNRSMLPRIDTVFLASAPEFGHISSTLVRQIAQLGGDVSLFVPENVSKALRKRVSKR